jgi:hypothetical protein
VLDRKCVLSLFGEAVSALYVSFQSNHKVMAHNVSLRTTKSLQDILRAIHKDGNVQQGLTGEMVAGMKKDGDAVAGIGSSEQ